MLIGLRDAAERVNTRAVVQFLRDFLNRVPRYRYFAIDRISFEVVKRIIEINHLDGHRQIQELTEAIEAEFRGVHEYVVADFPYPFFSSVAPWHRIPMRKSIEENDIDQLKAAWRGCLEPDPCHNTLFNEPAEESETWKLWEEYKEEAKKKDLWDDELGEIFRDLRKTLFPK
jgi:hypothetical protein